MSERALELLLMADCSTIEKIVLLTIAHHGKGNSGSGGWPSIRRLARIAGTSPSTVQVAIRDLAQKEWISWQSGSAKTNSANTYTIHIENVKLLDFGMYRPAAQAYTDQRHRPVPTATADLYRKGQKPVPATGNESSTEPINLINPEKEIGERSQKKLRDYYNANPEREYENINSIALAAWAKSNQGEQEAVARIEKELAARKRGERRSTQKRWKH